MAMRVSIDWVRWVARRTTNYRNAEDAGMVPPDDETGFVAKNESDKTACLQAFISEAAQRPGRVGVSRQDRSAFLLRAESATQEGLEHATGRGGG